jgi:hypothetical protein
VRELALLSRLLGNAACKWANSVSAEFHFFCAVEKNKKHSVGQCVDLDAVQLQYGLYVLGKLSKWFIFVLMLKF